MAKFRVILSRMLVCEVEVEAEDEMMAADVAQWDEWNESCVLEEVTDVVLLEGVPTPPKPCPIEVIRVGAPHT